MAEEPSDFDDGARTDRVREFYDGFVSDRMDRYLSEPNRRLERAIERVLPYVADDSTVLEIGCGIGVVTERLATRARRGHVWACDISDVAVSEATRRVEASNVRFRRADVVDALDETLEWVGCPIDVVVMIDVLEHLPREFHEDLFQRLRQVMRPDGVLILTFPSPPYQEHLRVHAPDELQVIDETIDLAQLMELGRRAGLTIVHFSFEDVWRRHQYIHAVLRQTEAVTTEVIDEWAARTALTLAEIVAATPTGSRIVLIDEGSFGPITLPDRDVLPFLELSGAYGGLPADDDVAMAELARVRNGATIHVALAEGSRWILGEYPRFGAQLVDQSDEVLSNERISLYRLGPKSPGTPALPA